jgi:hypothetical protein
MNWRRIESAIVDILKAEGLDLANEDGDTVVLDRGIILFSITELAKQLAERGIRGGL